jgi:hypothetical protein
MTNLVLFSSDYHPDIHTTFSKAKVRHYPPGYFELGQDHDFDFTYDGERILIGNLNMLVQFAEDGQYQHIYIVDDWDSNKILMAQMTGYYPVMIELSDTNFSTINELAMQHMFYDGVNASLQSATFPDQVMGGSNAFSSIAADVHDAVGQIVNGSIQTMKNMLVNEVRNLYIWHQVTTEELFSQQYANNNSVT